MTNPKTDFYVYVLFDADGIPRYVGKGRADRWLKHDRGDDPNNPIKNEFVIRTVKILGEVPKIKIRERMTESDAFVLEGLLIKAIGRAPKGPLTNLTDKRNGPSSERMKAWHDSQTPEQKLARSIKIKEGIAQNTTFEERSERSKQKIAKTDPGVLATRMRNWRALQSPEERRSQASKAGIASAAVRTEEHAEASIAALKRYNESLTTPELRREHFQKTGLSKATKSQLSAWGTKGVNSANNARTPEQRRANSRKGGLAATQNKKLKDSK